MKEYLRITGKSNQRIATVSGINDLSDIQRKYCITALKHFINTENITSITLSGESL